MGFLSDQNSREWNFKYYGIMGKDNSIMGKDNVAEDWNIKPNHNFMK